MKITPFHIMLIAAAAGSYLYFRSRSKPVIVIDSMKSAKPQVLDIINLPKNELGWPLGTPCNPKPGQYFAAVVRPECFKPYKGFQSIIADQLPTKMMV